MWFYTPENPNIEILHKLSEYVSLNLNFDRCEIKIGYLSNSSRVPKWHLLDYQSGPTKDWNYTTNNYVSESSRFINISGFGWQTILSFVIVIKWDCQNKCNRSALLNNLTMMLMKKRKTSFLTRNKLNHLYSLCYALYVY